jgi:hypothetical protein
MTEQGQACVRIINKTQAAEKHQYPYRKASTLEHN